MQVIQLSFVSLTLSAKAGGLTKLSLAINCACTNTDFEHKCTSTRNKEQHKKKKRISFLRHQIQKETYKNSEKMTNMGS